MVNDVVDFMKQNYFKFKLFSKYSSQQFFWWGGGWVHKIAGKDIYTNGRYKVFTCYG